MFLKHKKENYGKYPSNDHLNVALRYLLKIDNNTNVNKAISEIVFAIRKADGRFYDDVKLELEERNFIN